MSRRSLTDEAWRDEVIRRWQRRRNAPFRDLHMALVNALLPVVVWTDRQLRRWPTLYRWLSK